MITIIIILLTILIQSLINYIAQHVLDNINFTDIKFKKTTSITLIFLLLFAGLIIDTIIWATYLYTIKVFDDFEYAFVRALDCFTTLGSNGGLPEPWNYLGPIMALNGFLIISFAGCYFFGLIYSKELLHGEL